MAVANPGCNQDLCKTKRMQKEARGCGTCLVEAVGVGLLTPGLFMTFLRSRKLSHVENCSVLFYWPMCIPIPCDWFPSS